MTNYKTNTLCPLPWIHLSSHLDSTMRICCNTDHSGFIKSNDGNTIKLSEIENINEYFNVDEYKEIRKKMLNGQRPKICNKCYEIEDAGGLSVRQGYLQRHSKDESFNKQISSTLGNGSINVEVKSLDLSLSNKCNLKCIMCNPAASLPIKQDFEKLNIEYDVHFTEGASKNWNDSGPIENITEQISHSLRQYLTTGGEPFLSKIHLKTLKVLTQNNTASNISLQYHTNCTIRNDELFEIWNEFKEVDVHFSIDSIGILDEYIRFNSNWKTIENNVLLMLEHKKVRAEVHSCIQVLNIFNLTEIYDWILKLEKPNLPSFPFHIWMDQPKWLHIDILPKHLKEKAADKLLNYFAQYRGEKGVLFRERSQQILSYLERSINTPQDLEGLNLFKKRIRDFERIRNLDPIETIVPELMEIMN